MAMTKADYEQRGREAYHRVVFAASQPGNEEQEIAPCPLKPNTWQMLAYTKGYALEAEQAKQIKDQFKAEGDARKAVCQFESDHPNVKAWQVETDHGCGCAPAGDGFGTQCPNPDTGRPLCSDGLPLTNRLGVGKSQSKVTLSVVRPPNDPQRRAFHKIDPGRLVLSAVGAGVLPSDQHALPYYQNTSFKDVGQFDKFPTGAAAHARFLLKELTAEAKPKRAERLMTSLRKLYKKWTH